ncbi:MAG TPA: nuclear transport factor 2 family protein [Vicinamibacterales bacterium]
MQKAAALVSALVCAILLAAPAAAQSSSEADAVKALELKRLEAMTKNDLEALGSLLADDLIYAHSNGARDGKAAYLESLRSGKTRYKVISPELTNVRLFGDIAVIDGRAKMIVETDGKPQDMTLSYLDVWAKRAGKWQMIAWQSARMP